MECLRFVLNEWSEVKGSEAGDDKREGSSEGESVPSLYTFFL